MGRRSKPPIQIQFAPNQGGEIVSSKFLPPYVPFIDVSNGREDARKKTTRFYFSTPSREGALNARVNGIQNVGGNSSGSGYTGVGICDYAAAKISRAFGQELSRLAVRCLRGKFRATSTLRTIHSALKSFIDHLAKASENRLSNLTIYDVDFDDWLSFKTYLEGTTQSDIKALFYAASNVFASYPLTNLDGALRSISPPKRPKPAPETGDYSASFVIENEGYSDAVMYQLLAQFLYAVKRQIGYLKHYEMLSHEKLGDDWIDPHDKSTGAGTRRLQTGLSTEQFLADEANYKKILDIKLLWFKLGFRDGAGFIPRVRSYCRHYPLLTPKLDNYIAWEKSTHSLTASNGGSNIFGLYVKRSVKDDSTGSKGQLAFSLINIVLIYTGINKEVVLSWPSKKDGKSVLENFDTLFVKEGKEPSEVEIPGVKARTGAMAKDKIVHTPIVVGSPLYQMLREYEIYAKTDFDGPFFELRPTVVDGWGTQMGLRYIVYDDEGHLLKTLETKRFRKVFAATKLMTRMTSISSPQELADRLRDDLDHESLDVTLSHYLLRSNTVTSVLDIAIATITSDKIRSALEFEGQIDLDKKIPSKKSVFLCECADPSNPTHGESIAKECTHYDLCLGCKRSIVCKEHLPYICQRILQYEHQRTLMGIEWTAIYEDRWLIAMDTLQRYREADPANGDRVVEAAWLQARSGNVSLPPIFMTRLR